MKKTKFAEQQIMFALKQSESGVRVDEICRKMGVCEATFYKPISYLTVIYFGR